MEKNEKKNKNKNKHRECHEKSLSLLPLLHFISIAIIKYFKFVEKDLKFIILEHQSSFDDCCSVQLYFTIESACSTQDDVGCSR